MLQKNLALKYPTDTIVSLGDFNRSPAATDLLINEFHLIRARSQDQRWFTRRSGRQDVNNSEIDFITSNRPLTNLRKIPGNFGTDHDFICADMELSYLNDDRIPERKKKSWIIPKKIKDEEIAKIINDDDFPEQPFIQVAHKLQLTKRYYRKTTDLEQVQKTIRQIETSTQYRTTIIEEFKEIDKPLLILKKQLNNPEEELAARTKLEDRVDYVNKLLPRITKDLSSPIMRKLLDNLRRLLPKVFFKIINQRVRCKKSSVIAKKFKDKVVNEIIIPEQSIADHLRETFKDLNGLETYTGCSINLNLKPDETPL